MERRDCPNVLYQGFCADMYCNELLVFGLDDMLNKAWIFCNFCGQKQQCIMLRSISLVSPTIAEYLFRFLESMPAKKHSEFTKFRGISPFVCCLISPLFTKNGITRDWQVTPLDHLKLSSQFNPKLLANQTFSIKWDYSTLRGFGFDAYAYPYLLNTIHLIQTFNDQELKNALLPLTVTRFFNNGLFESISRATVGREIYWHPLKQAVKTHFIECRSWYLSKMKEFDMDQNDWQLILNDDPSPSNNKRDMLRMFALSNLMARPIILLNEVHRLKIGGEFSGVFLPILRSVTECKTNEILNPPLFIAWANSDQSYFVPMVPIIVFPPVFLSRRGELRKYIDFDKKNFAQVGTQCSISMKKMVKVINAMSQKYEEVFMLSPQLVSDFVEDLGNFADVTCESASKLHRTVLNRALQGDLWRCTFCWRLSALPKVPKYLLCKNGILYDRIKSLAPATVKHNNMYKVYPIGSFVYNETRDKFVPIKTEMLFCQFCDFVGGQMREQNFVGIEYRNGDHTRTPSLHSFCWKQMKHWWNGEEYDNAPMIIDFPLSPNSVEQVEWFDSERDPTKSSDVGKIAKEMIGRRYKMQSMSNKTLVNKVAQNLRNTIKIYQPTKPTNFCSNIFRSMIDNQDLAQVYIEEKTDYALFLESFVEKPCIHVERLAEECQVNEAESEIEEIKDPKMLHRIVRPHEFMMTSNIAKRIKIILLDSNGKMHSVTISPRYFDTLKYDHLRTIINDLFSIGPGDVFALFHKSGEKIQAVTNVASLHLKNADTVYVQRSPPYSDDEYFNPYELPSSVMLCMLAQLVIPFGIHTDASVFWEFILKSPSFFRPSGIIYEFLNTRYGLNDNVHFDLPHLFPMKVFVYCAADDLIKLCVRSFGHFVINESLRTSVRQKTGKKVKNDEDASIHADDYSDVDMALQDIAHPTFFNVLTCANS